MLSASVLPASSARTSQARMLVLAASPLPGDPGESQRRVVAGEIPDLKLEGHLNSVSVGLSDLACASRIVRRLPTSLGLAVLAWRRRKDFDVVLTWGDSLVLPLGLVLAVTRGARARHLGIVFWPFDDTSSSSARRHLKPLAWRVARRGVDCFLIPSPLQHRRVIEDWGCAPDRVLRLPLFTDTDFWSPRPGAGDRICSVGREMRDFPTLLAALADLDIPCHIAAGTGALNPAFETHDQRTRDMSGQALPAGVTVGAKSPSELRELYADSRFVVLPVLPTETDNGITAAIEAMAMGRAVIASSTAGISDLLQHDVNCVLVPPQDPGALAHAIEQLWNDPERCARLGAAGRAAVTRGHRAENWISVVQQATRNVGASSPATI